ncbi:MAG: hypothetical protein KBD37_00970 [Burkholderiales bacterium]|nr:hypothetical protein [Burkholderiales bacterium]
MPGTNPHPKIEDVYTHLTKTIPNYRMRDNQLQMVKQIDQCFTNANCNLDDGSNICVIEAPTGTGKSLAYLLAGVVNAQKLGKKLVVATATKTLQNQLIEKDIPYLIKYSGINFTYAMAKGRSNYLCPYQLEIAQQNLVSDMLKDVTQEREILKQLYIHFNKKTWNGDLDSAPLPLDRELKTQITTDKERCLAYSCPYNQKDQCNCPFYLNKEQLKVSEVIITNHSLLLADLNVKSGGVVLQTKPEDYLLCIDEGHNFADNALNSFSKKFELKHVISNWHHLPKLVYDLQNHHYLTDVIGGADEAALEHTAELITILDEILQLLRQNIHLFIDNQLILNDYLNLKLGTAFHERFVNAAYVAGELSVNLNKISDILKELVKSTPDSILEINLNKLSFYVAMVEDILITSQYIINQDDSRYNANAKWIDFKVKSGDEDFEINAGLTHVGNILLNKLWSQTHASVITSATLAVGKDFRYYLHKLGLNILPKVVTCKLPTNFEYHKQAQIVVPRFKHAPDFTSREQFIGELAQYLTKTLDYTEGFGTLVLFFNRSQLQDAYDRLPEKIQRNILLQTKFIGSQRLLNEHYTRINNRQASIIFGLNSFAEGVDLPALYCMHVIITKLPFETHNTPHNMVQEYWVKYEKGSYFMEISLPETSIRLIQAAGRLIRSETDYGQLSICDNRLVSKQYGPILLDALPNFARKYNSEFLSEALKTCLPICISQTAVI